MFFYAVPWCTHIASVQSGVLFGYIFFGGGGVQGLRGRLNSIDDGSIADLFFFLPNWTKKITFIHFFSSW